MPVPRRTPHHHTTRAVLAMSVVLALLSAACTTPDASGGRDGSGAPSGEPASTDPDPAGAGGDVSPAEVLAGGAATLTEAWPCGYGFATSDSDQRVAVIVTARDADAARDGLVPEMGAIGGPQDAWTGTVLVGTDLFASWCDDVVGEGTPTPEVEEEWTISEGTVATTCLEDVPHDLGCDATARMTDLTAQRPDGTTVPIGDLEVVNRFWGFFSPAEHHGAATLDLPSARLIELVGEREDGTRVSLPDLGITNQEWALFAG